MPPSTSAFERFVMLAFSLTCEVLLSRPRFKNVVKVVETPLLKGQLLFCESPAADVVDQHRELFLAPLKRAHEGVSRTGEATLEDAHRQLGGGPVQDTGPVVGIADVGRGVVIEFLLACRTLGEVVAERVAFALRI